MLLIVANKASIVPTTESQHNEAAYPTRPILRGLSYEAYPTRPILRGTHHDASEWVR